jgi:uncharacterized Fe-S center protein
MSKVWFVPVAENHRTADIAGKVVKLFDAAGFLQIFGKDEFAAVKIHFGEVNNTGHIKPDWLKPLLERIKESGAKPFLTDTNTLYQGKRENSVDHLMQAYRHGFHIGNLGVPVIIADGLISKNYSEVLVKGNYFSSVKIANDILHSETLVVMSHVTGHMLSGVGAAIKNVAMGAASRSGKQLQHADVKPLIRADKCKACGQCIDWCPKEAITIYDGAARIDAEACYGCGECIATCRHQSIRISFDDASDTLQEKMAEYALGATQGKQGRVCYFNFLIHITKECDCLHQPQDKECRDIGILASYDPVAIDQASVDLVQQGAGEDLFRRLWPENNYNTQISYAEKIGLGTRKHQLIKVEL